MRRSFAKAPQATRRSSWSPPRCVPVPRRAAEPISHARASGLSASLTSAAVTAPAARAITAVSIRSSLRPDCEIVRNSWSVKLSERRYTVAIFGAAAATGTPRWRSIRCLANVAACADEPLAQVTTTSGRRARSRAINAVSGAARLRACRSTAAAAWCNSPCMPAAIGVMRGRPLRGAPIRRPAPAKALPRGRARARRRGIAGGLDQMRRSRRPRAKAAMTARSRRPAPADRRRRRLAAPPARRYVRPPAASIRRPRCHRARHDRRCTG